MAEEETKTDETTTPNEKAPPDDSSKRAAELEARAKAAEERAAKLEAAEKKRADEAKAADAKKKADKAVEDGKAKDEIERLTKAESDARERLEKIEASMRARIDKTIEGLSESARAEIEAVREHLPLEKLDEFVAMKAGSSASSETPADDEDKVGARSMTPGGAAMTKERKFSNKAQEILKNYGVDPTIGLMTINQKSPSGTLAARDVLPVHKLIEENQKLAPPTVRLSKAELAKRKGRN